MRCEKTAAILLASVVVLGQALGTTGQTKKETAAKSPTGASLIRKDLLVPRAGELPLPRRNIFSPSESEASTRIVAPAAENPMKAPPGVQTEGENNPNQAPSEAFLNLSYLGFVRSAKGMIALVLLDGQPMAVNEGETIRAGFKLVKITPG